MTSVCKDQSAEKELQTVNCNCNYCYLFTHKKTLTSSLVSRETPLRARERTNHKLNWHYGINARIGTRATLVGGECAHHCATLAQCKTKTLYQNNLIWILLSFLNFSRVKDVLVICNNTKENLWEPEKMNVKFHKITCTSFTRYFQNFTSVFTFLVKFDIHFFGLPW